MQRILVADDEPRLVHIVSMFLSMEGYEVVGVEDGDQALQLLDRERFDLAILDVMMPGVDGIEVCRRLRDDPRTEQLPVLVFTSLSEAPDVERARLAGANHLITKPFSLPGLLAVIRNALGRAATAA